MELLHLNINLLEKSFIAENAYYNHFGFKKIPKDFNEYKNLLNNITKNKNNQIN